MTDLNAIADALIASVKGHVARALRPLVARLDEMDQRQPENVRRMVAEALAALPKPKDGESVDLVALAGEISAAAAKAVGALPVPRDGRDYDPAVLEEAVTRAVAGLPRAENGKDADADAIAEVVLAKVTAALDQIPAPKDGAPGKDADPAQIAALVESAVAEAVPQAVTKAVSALPAPQPGKDADPELIRRLVADAVAALPKAKDGEPGRSVDLVELSGQIAAAAATAVAALPPPAKGDPGKDFDPELIRQRVDEILPGLVERAQAALVHHSDQMHAAMRLEIETMRSQLAGLVDVEVARRVALVPPPQNGKDADPALLRAEVERAVAALPVPRDGKDADPDVIRAAVASAVAELPETTKTLDPEVLRVEVQRAVADAVAQIPKAKDGASVTLDDVRPALEAEVARWALDFERRAGETLQRVVDRMPEAKDGRDGFTPDDLQLALDGRVLTITLCAGERRISRELVLAGMPIDRGVYRKGVHAEAGDGYTYGGGYWIAKQDTDEPPAGPSAHWRLAVKRGRDAPSRGLSNGRAAP